MKPYKKPTKTVIINGKVYTATRERNYIPPAESPKRAQTEYVIPRHTSLFVKVLEETIDANMSTFFAEMQKKSEELKKQSLESVLKGDSKEAMALLRQAQDLDQSIKNSNRLKIAWMSSLLVKYDSLTSQIVTRLS